MPIILTNRNFSEFARTTPATRIVTVNNLRSLGYPQARAIMTNSADLIEKCKANAAKMVVDENINVSNCNDVFSNDERKL